MSLSIAEKKALIVNAVVCCMFLIGATTVYDYCVFVFQKERCVRSLYQTKGRDSYWTKKMEYYSRMKLNIWCHQQESLNRIFYPTHPKTRGTFWRPKSKNINIRIIFSIFEHNYTVIISFIYREFFVNQVYVFFQETAQWC